MDIQELLHLHNCLLCPEEHYHEIETVANLGTNLHEQICMAVWNKKWREHMTPAALEDIIEYHEGSL